MTTKQRIMAIRKKAQEAYDDHAYGDSDRLFKQADDLEKGGAVFLSMKATFNIRGARPRVETVVFIGVSNDDVMSQWGGVLNYLKREDPTVSSVTSSIEPIEP